MAIIASLTWPFEKMEKNNGCSTIMLSVKPQTSVPEAESQVIRIDVVF